MNKPGKKDLQDIRKYFEAPEPQGKQGFLQKVSQIPVYAPGKTSIAYITWVQFSYISKWLWVFSAFIFVCIFISSRYNKLQHTLYKICILQFRILNN